MSPTSEGQVGGAPGLDASALGPVKLICSRSLATMTALLLFIKEEALDFIEYDTPKFLHIRSKRVGIFCRLTQLVCLAYVVGYDLLYLKGYQATDTGVGGATAKLKGVDYTNLTHGLPGGVARLWDPPDYVIPPHMNSAFFVMTNVIVTKDQAQSACTEDATLPEAACRSDADCPRGKIMPAGNGARTGVCLKALNSTNATAVCEIHAWCPVENDTFSQPEAILSDAKDFTVLIKNYVYFPGYKKHRSNILENGTKSYLRSCKYNKTTDPQCPIFRLGDIVGNIPGENYQRLALLGGVISIRIDWDCDLDYNIRHCLPQYSFARLDSEATDSLVAQGYNFRYSYNYVENGVAKRTLLKAYGILFLVTVTAKAGAFSIIPTLMKVGSGLGLLGISTVLCDFLIFYVDRKKQSIKGKKFETVGKRGKEVRNGVGKNDVCGEASNNLITMTSGEPYHE